MKRGMHILMTADAVGGVWQYALDLSAELCRGGCEVTLAVLGPAPSPAQREQALAIGGVELVETGLDLDWLSEGPGPVERAAEQIASLRARCGAHLLHCNSPALAGGARFDCPLVVVDHGCIATWWDAVKHEALPARFEWHRSMARRGLLAADAVAAPSASHAAAVQRIYRLARTPHSVHNGRRPGQSGIAAARHTRQAMTVGRLWDEAKNIRLLDEVAGLVDLPFRAVGATRGPHGETCDLAHLEPIGQVSAARVDELLAARPIFVSAARFEPFGLAVLEAAGAGCPLVLADIPTFRELWDGAALFADPASPDAFAAAIGRLDGDRALHDRHARAAAARAQRYTPAAQADETKAVYAIALARCEAAA